MPRSKCHQPGTRRKRARKPAGLYAQELIARYGKRAGQVASNRYDAAETEETAAYYENVMTEIERGRHAAAMATAPSKQHAKVRQVR
jgi:hypothetical protein